MTKRTSNKGLLTDLVKDSKEAVKAAAPDAGQPDGTRRSQVGGLVERSTRLAELASGDLVEQALRWVDPDRCRMWERHNRRYNLLSKENCADLIDGLRVQGRQEFPAIVRRVTDDPNYDYEVICGARRHWTVTWLRSHNYPQFKFLIEERDLNDEAAFRLSDIENRDRRDISDFERATDYLDAVKRYYDGKQKDMAARLEVSESWLSMYLDLARLPQHVVDAYFDVTHLKVQHGRDLKPLLKDGASKQRVITAAKEIASEQKAARTDGKAPRDGKQVTNELIAAGRRRGAKKDRGTLAEFTTESGAAMMTVTRQGRSGLVLKVKPNSGASRTELMAAVKTALDEHYSEN